jgi:hypothetical protein
MEKTVYIFGAGASYAYDQSPTGVRPPLARGFFKAYMDLPISEDLEVRVGDLVNHVRDIYGLTYHNFYRFNQDIEKFMTHLDIQVRQLATLRQLLQKEKIDDCFIQFWQSIKVYDQMLFLITHVLNEIQNGPVSNLYSSLIKASNNEDTFITFNWDTLLDRCLASLGSWNADDGYGVPFLKIYDKGWRDPNPKGHKPRLLKLHGSTNWLVPYYTWRLDTAERCMLMPSEKRTTPTMNWDYQFDPLMPGAGIKFHLDAEPWQGKPIPKPPDRSVYPICMIDSTLYYSCYKDRWRTGYQPFSYFFPPDHPETPVPLMPLTIAPVLFKMYDEFDFVLDPLWKAAEEEIKLADRLVIIGYSFPTTDNRVVDLFRIASSRSEQPTIEVVNPDPEHTIHLLTSFVGFNHNKVIPIPTDFASYIKSISKQYTASKQADDNNELGKQQIPENDIVPITKGKFEAYPITADFGRFILSDEKEWYENQVKYHHYLGVLCRDRTDNGWGYVILAECYDGYFRWFDGESGLNSRIEARDKLLNRMKYN